MRAPDWLLLAALPLVACVQHDVCNSRPRDLLVEPLCVYRSPDPEGPTEVQVSTPEPPVPESTNPRVWELSRANGRFALSLYKQLVLSRTPEQNVFMSPLSISTAFAMTKLAACNRTLQQIMEVFEFDSIKQKTSDQVHVFFVKLNCRVFRKKDETTSLVSSNRLFGDKRLAFSLRFQNASRRVYGASLLPLDFQENPEEARVSINDWISNQTENLIRDTLPVGALDSSTVLVLVNTIYFKGQWKNKFDKDNVYESEFRVSESRSCRVHMMYQENRFRYRDYVQDQVQVLEMPYRGDHITMVIILPAAGHALSQVEQTLDLNRVSSWLDGLRDSNVHVHVPRFRVEDSFSVKDKLQEMGLTDLFSPERASLPGLLDGDSAGLYISDAFHKAFLEVNEEGSEAAASTVYLEPGPPGTSWSWFQVNEEGSEAAASTSVVAVGRSINLDREVLMVNRPFLVLIREASINSLLFTARVADPCSA